MAGIVVKEDEGPVQILVSVVENGITVDKETYDATSDDYWSYKPLSDPPHSSEQFRVVNVNGDINIYGSSSNYNWYLTVGEKSDGGVDTYPTFQPVPKPEIEHRIFTQTTSSGKIALGFKTSKHSTQYYLTPETSTNKIRTTETKTPQYVFTFK